MGPLHHQNFASAATAGQAQASRQTGALKGGTTPARGRRSNGAVAESIVNMRSRIFPQPLRAGTARGPLVPGARPVPRSQRPGFTPKLQRLAKRRCFPHALRAGTARGPWPPDRDRSHGRSARDSRPGSRGSPNVAASHTRCAPGRRAARGPPGPRPVPRLQNSPNANTFGPREASGAARSPLPSPARQAHESGKT